MTKIKLSLGPTKLDTPKIKTPSTGIKIEPLKLPTLQAKTKPKLSLPPLKPKVIKPKLTTKKAKKIEVPKLDFSNFMSKSKSLLVETEEVIDKSYRGIQLYDGDGNPIELDKDQQHAVDMIIEGKSMVVTGGAGTGKTTTMQAQLLALWKYHKEKISDTEYKIPGAGMTGVAPNIACIAFTNMAVKNMQKKILSHPELAEIFSYNITTAHNLLEFAPASPGEEGKGRFYPRRNRFKKLNIVFLFIDEATMIGVGNNQIWNYLYDALRAGTQIVLMGDINQLPPVGGKSILNYGLTQLPIVELTTVHRQALDNPIVAQARNCLDGKMIVEDWNPETMKGVRVVSGTSKPNVRVSSAKIKRALKTLLPNLYEKGEYDPNQDMILIPYNKSEGDNIGTIEVNAILGDYLAKKRNATVYEIKTGFNTLYLSVGDTVYTNKRKGTVVNIELNSKYTGLLPQQESKTLDYWGHDADTLLKDNTHLPKFSYDNLDIDKMVLELDSEEDKEGTSKAASHTVTVRLEDTNYEVNLSSAGDLSDTNFSLGYALTVHKSQGSEWRRAYFILHDSHKAMLFRELLYTGMTRPRELLTLITQTHVLKKTISNPRIKGNTLKAKLAYFNSGALTEKVSFEIKED